MEYIQKNKLQSISIQMKYVCSASIDKCIRQMHNLLILMNLTRNSILQQKSIQIYSKTMPISAISSEIVSFQFIILVLNLLSRRFISIQRNATPNIIFDRPVSISSESMHVNHILKRIMKKILTAIVNKQQSIQIISTFVSRISARYVTTVSN